MLILPPGHARSLATRRQLRPREKWMLGTGVGLVAAVVVVLVIAFANTARSSGHGCVDVIVPAATGAGELYRCGAQARALCQSVPSVNRGNPVLGHAIARECAKARIPVTG